jgi:hypothetical protein
MSANASRLKCRDSVSGISVGIGQAYVTLRKVLNEKSSLSKNGQDGICYVCVGRVEDCLSSTSVGAAGCSTHVWYGLLACGLERLREQPGQEDFIHSLLPSAHICIVAAFSIISDLTDLILE